mmetsp:Transcript_7474/g.9721  ORF Transcript_7474/g.9721 Transcript_7474/m.9721 type:complete len:408 (-) Transcript_7474:331-1554(-)
MNSQGQNDGRPPENPVLNWYNNWSSTTPFVTRSSCVLVVILYLLSWFISLETSINNIPLYSILHFEVYRLIFSPLYASSLLSVIFIILSFSGTGSQLEQAMGSTGLLALMATVSLATNVIFVVVCYLLYMVGNVEALLYSCGSFWIIFMGLVVVESLNSGMESRKLMFLPIQIPIKFYPIALYVFFILFTGIRLDTLIALGVGYAYVFGYMKRFEPSQTRLDGWENGCLSGLVQKPGYITTSGAVGTNAWLPVNNPSGHPSMQRPRGGLASLFGGMQQQQQQQPPQDPSSGPSGNVFGRGGGGGKPAAAQPSAFEGSGFTLGSGSGARGGYAPVATQDPEAARLARLQALESRGVMATAVAEPTAPGMITDEAIMSLQSMGYGAAESRDALEKSGGSVEGAVEFLSS